MSARLLRGSPYIVGLVAHGALTSVHVYERRRS